jgi:hypothetical protein
MQGHIAGYLIGISGWKQATSIIGSGERTHPTIFASISIPHSNDFKFLYTILELFQKLQLPPIVNQITANLANLQEVLQRGFCESNPNIVDTICCTLLLNSFYRVTGRGQTLLIDQIEPILSEFSDYRLDTAFLTEALQS